MTTIPELFFFFLVDGVRTPVGHIMKYGFPNKKKKKKEIIMKQISFFLIVGNVFLSAEAEGLSLLPIVQNTERIPSY